MATLYNDNPHAASLLRLAVSGRVPGPTEEDPESKSHAKWYHEDANSKRARYQEDL